MGVTAQPEGLGVTRIQFDGCRAAGDGLIVVADQTVRAAEDPIGHAIVRIEADRFLAVGDGVLELALAVVGEAPTMVRHGVGRIAENGLAVVGDQRLKVAGFTRFGSTCRLKDPAKPSCHP